MLPPPIPPSIPRRPQFPPAPPGKPEPPIYWLDALVACIFPILAVCAFMAGMGTNTDGNANVGGRVVIVVPMALCFFTTLLRWSFGLWFGWLLVALGLSVGLLLVGGLGFVSQSDSAKQDFLLGLLRMFAFIVLMIGGGMYMGLRNNFKWAPDCR